MKYFTVLFMWSLLTITSLQYKADYRIKLSRAEFPRFNKSYVYGKVWISKPNRYTNAVNGEFVLIAVPPDTKVKIQMYEFLSNEYRPFAVNFERNLCDFMALEYKTMLYPDFVRLGAHMAEPRCPGKPGNYSFANFTPDDANYPFHKAMLEMSYWHGPLEMGVVQFYTTLDRDAVIRERYG